MAPLEEPTVAEMIRAVGSDVRILSANIARMESAVTQYVTQEQRNADQALAAERERQQNEHIAELKNRAVFVTRTIWTAGIAPVLVWVLLWIVQGGAA